MATKDVTTRVVLETVARVRDTNERLKDELVRLTGQPVKVIESALFREDAAGRIDWGVSVWGAWLTPKGQADLEQLQLGDGT